jgi:hypothetical protein
MQQKKEKERGGRDLPKHLVLLQRKKIPLDPPFSKGEGYKDGK